MSNKHFSTRCIHAGQEPDPSTGAIMTPVYQTSTYVQTSPGEFIDNFDYSRSANPTRTALEANLASLEGGKHGICFASGSASLAACIHLLSAGDHVLLCDDVYVGTFRMFNNIFEYTDKVISIVKPQRLIYFAIDGVAPRAKMN